MFYWCLPCKTIYQLYSALDTPQFRYSENHEYHFRENLTSSSRNIITIDKICDTCTTQQLKFSIMIRVFKKSGRKST